MARQSGGGSTIPTAPKPHGGGHHKPPSSGGSHSSGSSGGGSGGSGGSRGGSGGGGSGGSGGDAVSKAQHKAANRYIQQARVLQKQLNALKIALGPRGLRHALDIQLAGVRLNQNQADALLTSDYKKRVGALTDTASDNEKAAASGTYMALTNRGRERANAISEATAQGAGESDLLRAQGASLRNWNSNQNEVNRSFYDTLTSVNSSLTDLTVDTRTARVNNAKAANDDRNQLWTDYYGNRSEVLTNMYNIKGQQADYYSSANEMSGSKKSRKLQKGAAAASGHYARQASLTAGKAFHNPGVSKALRNWSGAAAVEGNLSNDSTAGQVSEHEIKAPEGATLRRWDQ